MMGGCGSLCDCLQRRGNAEPPVDNPFRPTKARSSREIYYIIEPHPNGVKY